MKTLPLLISTSQRVFSDAALSALPIILSCHDHTSLAATEASPERIEPADVPTSMNTVLADDDTAVDVGDMRGVVALVAEVGMTGTRDASFRRHPVQHRHLLFWVI